MNGDVTALSAESLPRILRELRESVAGAQLPFPLPGVEEARQVRADLLALLDDHVLPRAEGELPVLVVVAGPSGVGKSTLVNSLVGDQVAIPGVLRPTTRSPVIAAHPDDVEWFMEPHVLAGLRRVSDASDKPDEVRVCAAPRLPKGLALMDCPDLDTMAADGGALAQQLLAAGDVWLFVTSAARYADAVPWTHLDEAHERGAAMVVVLNRVPHEGTSAVLSGCRSLMLAHGLADIPVFTINESVLSDGVLSEFDVVILRDWLQRVATEPPMRASVVGRTQRGTIRVLPKRAMVLADAVDEQAKAASAVRDAFSEAIGSALDRFDLSLRKGVLSVPTAERWRSVDEDLAKRRLRESRLWFLRRATRDPRPDEALAAGVRADVAVAAHEALAAAVGAAVAVARGVPGASTEPARPLEEIRSQLAQAVDVWVTGLGGYAAGSAARGGAAGVDVGARQALSTSVRAIATRGIGMVPAADELPGDGDGARVRTAAAALERHVIGALM